MGERGNEGTRMCGVVVVVVVVVVGYRERERARARDTERGLGRKGEEDTTHRHKRQGTPGRDRDAHITQGHLRNRKPGSMVTLTTHVA